MDIKNVLELLQTDMLKIEEALCRPFTSKVDVLREILSQTVLNRGKRVRPMMLALIAKMLGYNGELLAPVGAAVEHIHAASILHDDVIDEAVTRRGRTSINKAYGNSMAVLAGDYLYTRSFMSVLSLPDKKVAEKVINILTKTVSEMSEGEILQLSSIMDFNITKEQYYEIIYGKTVALFSAACHCAGILSRAPERLMKDISEYGYNVGFGFQLMDDILDYFGDAAVMGKDPGADLLEGKITLPVLLLMREAGKETVKEIFLSEKTLEKKFEELLVNFAAYDIERKSFDIAGGFVDNAIKALSGMPENEYKKALVSLTSSLKNRGR